MLKITLQKINNYNKKYLKLRINIVFLFVNFFS